MLKVGLTGGIASGKSIISQLFTELGVPVIDTDRISHQLMQKGQSAYLKTIEHFGAGILNPDKTINRRVLRQQVFQHPEQRRWLEQMIHPLIRETAITEMQQVNHADYILLVVPLLFEAGYEELVDHVIAIDCPSTKQMQRLQQRDGITETLARQMINAQNSNEQRISRADSIIHNRDDNDRSRDVLELHKKLLELAQLTEN